jgi:hypothetical protein
MANGYKVGKYYMAPKLVIAIAAVIMVVIGVCAGVASARKTKAGQAAKLTGCTFDTTVFEDVSDAQCLNEKMIVFTDSQGKKGIMTLDGVITQEANQDAVYTVSDAWRSVKYVCEGPLSEYRLLIDPETAIVTNRQYHGVTEPEKTAYWSVAGNHLAWYDKLGYAGEAGKYECNLEEGLYPVQSAPEDGGKYGFINENLGLEIALLYDGAGEFSEGLAPVRRKGSWGYINEKGVTAIDFLFESISEAGAYGFSNGLAPAKQNGFCGIINRRGETVVAFEFEDILPGKDGKFVGKKGSAWGLITVNREIVEAESTSPVTEKQTRIPAQGNFKVVTSGSPLNLRSAPDTGSAILARIPNGTIISVAKTENGWANVTYNSVSGWVSTDFIRELETQPETAPSTDEMGAVG